MTDKTEIAKMATEFTVALITSKSGLVNSLVRRGLATTTDKDKPDALILFDVIYDHLSEKLK